MIPYICFRLIISFISSWVISGWVQLLHAYAMQYTNPSQQIIKLIIVVVAGIIEIATLNVISYSLTNWPTKMGSVVSTSIQNSISRCIKVALRTFFLKIYLIWLKYFLENLVHTKLMHLKDTLLFFEIFLSKWNYAFFYCFGYNIFWFISVKVFVEYFYLKKWNVVLDIMVQ